MADAPPAAGTHATPATPATPGMSSPEAAGNHAAPLRDETASENDRLWAMLIHLTVLVPVFSIVPLLCIWLQKRNDSVYIDDHGKEALSFQISMFIWQVVAGIINGIKANQGYYVRYPITIRFFN